jgi:hypothetical protein
VQTSPPTYPEIWTRSQSHRSYLYDATHWNPLAHHYECLGPYKLIGKRTSKRNLRGSQEMVARQKPEVGHEPGDNYRETIPTSAV